jgi:hypothetical protein
MGVIMRSFHCRVRVMWSIGGDLIAHCKHQHGDHVYAMSAAVNAVLFKMPELQTLQDPSTRCCCCCCCCSYQASFRPPSTPWTQPRQLAVKQPAAAQAALLSAETAPEAREAELELLRPSCRRP